MAVQSSRRGGPLFGRFGEVMQFVCRVVAAFVAMLVAVPAVAQSNEDDRLRLFRYYITHVAVDVCEIDIPKEQETRFVRATDRLEEKVGATKAEMDATFKQIKDGASQSPKGFCQQYRPVALETLKPFE